MHTQRTLAAATFLPAAAYALTDTGAPGWVYVLAGVFVVVGVCGLVCYACCAVSSRCAQWEEDHLGVRRS